MIHGRAVFNERSLSFGHFCPTRKRWSLALAVVVGLVEGGILLAWQRNAYWSFSDGVYALSARELLHGTVPYRDFAAAQPPPVFLAGAALLAVRDALASLRVGLGLVNLSTAGLVGLCVWRLDGRLWLALLAAALAPLLPISLATHAQLGLAAKLMLGFAGLSRWRGVVGQHGGADGRREPDPRAVACGA
jgi:hypothetical protein